jgi:hypothetical protein
VVGYLRPYPDAKRELRKAFWTALKDAVATQDAEDEVEEDAAVEAAERERSTANGATQ